MLHGTSNALSVLPCSICSNGCREGKRRDIQYVEREQVLDQTFGTDCFDSWWVLAHLFNVFFSYCSLAC